MCGDPSLERRRTGARSTLSRLHRENNAEPRFTTHHARVTLCRFFKRVCLNHRAYAAQLGETQSVVFIGRCPGSPPLNCSASGNELYRCDL